MANKKMHQKNTKKETNTKGKLKPMIAVMSAILVILIIVATVLIVNHIVDDEKNPAETTVPNGGSYYTPNEDNEFPFGDLLS